MKNEKLKIELTEDESNLLIKGDETGLISKISERIGLDFEKVKMLIEIYRVELYIKSIKDTKNEILDRWIELQLEYSRIMQILEKLEKRKLKLEKEFFED